jgi:hypothetical protein
MKKKEIIRLFILILCISVLFFIPWTSVFGVKDEALKETIDVDQNNLGVFIVFILVLRFIYKNFLPSLPQDLKREEIKEADQEDRKQLLFKPRNRIILMYLFISLMGIWMCVYGILLRKPNEDPIIFIIGSPFMIGIGLFILYIMPVFIFAEDSVHIKSFLLYIIGIDRKTVIKYADITSVGPDANFNSNAYGIDRRNRLGISVGGTTTFWVLGFYTGDTIAKIYLRFKEKLGDKVILE